MRKQIITKSLDTLPFISVILSYDYYVERKLQKRLKGDNFSYINDVRVVSKDEVLVCDSMGYLKLINLVTGVRQSFNRENMFYKFELLNSSQIVAVHSEKLIKIWSLDNFTTPQYVFPSISNYIFVLPNSKFILYGFTDYITIRDDQEALVTLGGHDRNITCLALMGNKLISGSNNGELKIWNLETEELEANLEGHTNSINTIAVMGNLFCSGSSDKTIRIWNNKECIKTIHTEVEKIIALDKMRFISTVFDNINIWNINGLKELHIRIKHNNIKLLPNNQLLIVLDNGFKIWDLDTDKSVTTWTYGKPLKSFDVNILPDSKILLTINNDLAIF